MISYFSKIMHVYNMGNLNIPQS